MNPPNNFSKTDDEVETNPGSKSRVFFIEEQLSKQFSKLGSLIARHPFHFAFIPVVLTAILSTGILYIKVNRDFNYLLASTDGRAQQVKRLVHQRFPMNTSTFFDMPRATMSSEFLMLTVTAADKDSMLRGEVFQEVQYLDEIVRNVTIWLDGRSLNYADICGIRFGKCAGNDFLELAPYLKDIRSGRYKVHYPIYLNKLTFSYKEYIQSLGGVEIDDNGFLRDAKALRLIYGLDVSNKSKVKAIQKWQIEVSRVVNQRHFKWVKTSVLSEDFLKEEIKSYTNDMLKRAPVIVSVVVLFSFLSSMTSECVRSKQWLGPMACVSAGLAISSAVGFLCYVGVEYVDFCIVLCYCVLTTEIDDAFILIASWRATDPEGSVEKRLSQVYSRSAVSITITSLTTVLSFSIGISSAIPAIKLCCAYGACVCLFAYAYTLTFFGGCMALSGYREEAKLNPFTFRRVKENPTDQSSTQFLSMSLQSKIVELLLRSKFFKGVVIVVFFGLLAAGIQGITTIKYGSELSDGFTYESATNEMFKNVHKYFGRYTMPVQIIFTEHLNYADPAVQETLEGVLRNFSSYKHVAEPDLELSWLKHFKIFTRMQIGQTMLRPYNLSDEGDFVYALKHVFLKMPQTYPYRDDIFFDEEGTKILSSRFIVLMKDIDSTETETKAVKHLYSIANEAPIQIELLALAFHLIESVFSVPAVTAKMAAISCILVSLIFILFAPNIPYALCVSAVVLCSVTEVIGLVAFWGVKLDYVVLIAFSFSIGLCINYPSHVTFAILMGKNNGPRNTKTNAFYVLVYPISQGCLSTVLGLLAVAAHPHYISQSAFKVISVISLLSTIHALFTIPVMLSMFEDGYRMISSYNSRGKMRRELTFEKCPLTESGNGDSVDIS